MFIFLLKDQKVLLFFFFFQAEDGIRDATVTGVQTSALPICSRGLAALFPQPERARDGGQHQIGIADRREVGKGSRADARGECDCESRFARASCASDGEQPHVWRPQLLPRPLQLTVADRKSTRLNSSHGSISYAVFCLKKKK